MRKTYSRAYRILHWAMAGLILLNLPLGLMMADMPDTASNKNLAYALHKSLGLLVFGFVVLRLFFRVKEGEVSSVTSLTCFERAISQLVHYSLWVLMILVPLTGYLGVSSCCAPLQLFGVGNFAWPISLSPPELKQMFHVHEIASKLMLVLVLLHIGAALMHHFVKKDNVLTRMLRG